MVLYYFLLPGNHWYYRLTKEIELLRFLLSNFIFNARTLKKIVDDLLKRQKCELSNGVLLKISGDIYKFTEVLERHENKKWVLGRSILDSLKKIILGFEGVAEKTSDKGKAKFLDLLRDVERLNMPVNFKEKMWQNADADLTNISRYSERLGVSSTE